MDSSGNLAPFMALLPWENEHQILNHLCTSELSQHNPLARRFRLCYRRGCSHGRVAFRKLAWEICWFPAPLYLRAVTGSFLQSNVSLGVYRQLLEMKGVLTGGLYSTSSSPGWWLTELPQEVLSLRSCCIPLSVTDLLPKWGFVT